MAGVTYPVRVPRKHYGGSKQAQRRKTVEYNEMAGELEAYINRKVEESNQRCVSFTYGYMALELRLPLKDVRRILFGIECGHNGFEVWKPGEYEAWRRSQRVARRAT